MLPLRLVFDTNCIISAAMKPVSLQRTALILGLTKPARMYVSMPIIAEYAEVLARRGLGISKGIRLQSLQLIRNRSYVVTPKRKLDICPDSDDNIFLECAEAARADYLITGNLKHFPSFWKSTKIITAREFVDLAAPHLL
jgi:putative PIN family toxin of toxin-antitoxin system